MLKHFILLTVAYTVAHRNLRYESCGQVEILFPNGRTRRMNHCMIALRHELNENFKVDVKVEPFLADSNILKTIYLDGSIFCDDDFIEDVLKDVRKEIISKNRRNRSRISTCLRKFDDI